MRFPSPTSRQLKIYSRTCARSIRTVQYALLGIITTCIVIPSNADEIQAAAVSHDWYSPTFWRTIDGTEVSECWEFAKEEIRLVHPRGGGSSLLSGPMPEQFELSFQWKIGPKANSGLKYRVRNFQGSWLGIEYQMIDEPIPLDHPHKGSTASIYDLVAPPLDKPLNPVDQWNEAKIVATDRFLEHYLNGTLVARLKTQGPEWDSSLVRSKFYGHHGFGQAQSGDCLMLTDHGGFAAYRNFQLTTLVPETDDTENDETISGSQNSATESPQLANGMRNSWADSTSIVLWTRTTRDKEMVLDGPQFKALSRQEQTEILSNRDPEVIHAAQLPEGSSLDEMQGACPGAEGEVRLSYFPIDARANEIITPWETTVVDNDFTHQWALKDLKPGTKYAAVIEAKPKGSEKITAVIRGSFETAPKVDSAAPTRFCMTTCHDYLRRDLPDGHKIYAAMKALNPSFTVHAGDVEYYDKPDPWAATIDLMRFKWGRLFALPVNREYYSNHTTYFQKDDHDTLKNDCWAGQRYGSVTFEEGQRLFNDEQFPSRGTRYMTISWGRDLQIWLLEGRDFRSPNNMEDGPQKTILGAEQKQWLFDTIQASSAKFKLVFSPTPIVGPDRNNKNDNHANEKFTYEGDELRNFFSGQNNVLLFCGDRHWQYASEDSTGHLWEFGCGPGSERHELGWRVGDVRPEHRFLRVKGGFLSGELTYDQDVPTIHIRHHDVNGNEVSHFGFKIDDQGQLESFEKPGLP